MKIMEQKCFLWLKSLKKTVLTFQKTFQKVSYKMEAQKIINLLNDLSNGESKFATAKMVCYRQSYSKR